jgi:hypothetical protein
MLTQSGSVGIFASMLLLTLFQAQGPALASDTKAAESPEVEASRARAPLSPYDIEDVTFSGGASGVTLSGTLTKPRRGAARSCVVLLPGSGMVDRDDSAYGPKPLLVLADALTRRGYVVLR